MRGLLLGLFVVALASDFATAQMDRYQEMAAARTHSRLYYDAFVLPGPDGAPLLTVEFRIPNDRLVFMRHAEGLDDKLFRASVSITVELYQEERLVEEKIWRSETFASEYGATVDPLRSTTGSVTLQVEEGEYGVRVRLNDLNTEASASTPIRHTRALSFKGVQVGEAILADTVVNTDEARYVATLNLGGDARFGDGAVAVIPLSVGSQTGTHIIGLKWELRKLEAESVRNEMRVRRRKMESDRRRSESDEDVPRVEPPPMMEGGSVVDSGRVAFASFLPIGALTDVDVHQETITLAQPGDATQFYLVAIDLKGRRLENGTYVLDTETWGGDETAASSTRFSTHWPDMPVSLLDVDVAIKNMRFIVDKSVIDRLRDGSREDKINNFKTFWSQRDPTPDTAFNELMVEYFRRVDYAAVEYRTGPGVIPNGLESDRARIYIVHGPPDDISRVFPEEGGVLETWVYADGKSFTFESASSIDPFHIVREG